MLAQASPESVATARASQMCQVLTKSWRAGAVFVAASCLCTCAILVTPNALAMSLLPAGVALQN